MEPAEDLTLARQGDDAAFTRLVEPLRPGPGGRHVAGQQWRPQTTAPSVPALPAGLYGTHGRPAGQERAGGAGRPTGDGRAGASGRIWFGAGHDGASVGPAYGAPPLLLWTRRVIVPQWPDCDGVREAVAPTLPSPP